MTHRLSMNVNNGSVRKSYIFIDTNDLPFVQNEGHLGGQTVDNTVLDNGLDKFDKLTGEL